MNVEQPKRRRLRPTDPDYVAPDGGWGWLIVIACGCSNLSIFPMIQQFGLLFRDRFKMLGITNSEMTTIINLNNALTMCVGLFNGPIYRKFTFRQVALCGSSLVVTSLLITTQCQVFWTYLIFFAIIYGSAVGLTQAANALALNTYFKNNRSIATGLSWGTTAFGPIVWPYIITYLLDIYGTNGTLLIYASFALHAVMFSLLLQPVHWHTKFRKYASIPLLQIDASKLEEKNETICETESNIKEDEKPKTDLWQKIITSFNLELLKDKMYLNIMVGLTICNFTEINFSILTPFILKEFNFENYQIATFMSLLGATDITWRFLIPFIANRFTWNHRVYFIFGVILTSLGRVLLIHTQTYRMSLIVAIMIGFGKGLGIVFLALIIPNHVSLQKLPAAAGLQLAASGILFIVLGPVVGYVRDLVQSYVVTLHLLNVFCYITVISWTIELMKTSKKSQETTENA